MLSNNSINTNSVTRQIVAKLTAIKKSTQQFYTKFPWFHLFNYNVTVPFKQLIKP